MLRTCFFLLGAILLWIFFAGMAAGAQQATPSASAPLKAVDGLRQNAEPSAPAPHVQNWPALVMAAAPYARFRDLVEQASHTPPQSAQDLERTMLDLAGYDGAKFSKSFHAFAVLRAMQAPLFADGVQHWGRIYDRRQLIANLHMNPAYVEQMPGYAAAKSNVLGAIEADRQATLRAGGAYKALAYTLQHKKWGTRVGRGKALRLAAVRNAYLEPIGYSRASLEALQRIYTLQAPMSVPYRVEKLSTNPPFSGGKLMQMLANHNWATAKTFPAHSKFVPPHDAAPARRGELQDILATAAIHILDPQAPYPSALPPRNTPDVLAECVDWSRMYLNQCVAATHFVYEGSFCIARHQLKDSGQCIGEFIDGAQPVTQ
jgi:hypothetical protein